METEVAVVGGGAIGTATAWLLAGNGARVVLLEEHAPRAVRHTARGTAWSAHPSWLPPGTGPQLGVAVQLWRTLEAETGATVLRIADAADHGDITTLEALAARDPDAQWLPPDAAATRWSGARFTGPVLYRRGRAVQVHADQAIAALTAAAAGHGAVLRHRTRVTAVEAIDDTRVEIRTRAGRVRAGQVVFTTAPDGMDTLDLPRRVEGRELHFTPRLSDPTLDTARWPLLAHHHLQLGLVRAVACARGHIAVGVHGAQPSPQDLRNHVGHWLPGLETDRPEPVVPAAMSTALAPVSIERTGPVICARGAGTGSVLATAQGRALADAVLGVLPVSSPVP